MNKYLKYFDTFWAIYRNFEYFGKYWFNFSKHSYKKNIKNRYVDIFFEFQDLLNLSNYYY